jgi:hypothetical protein
MNLNLTINGVARAPGALDWNAPPVIRVSGTRRSMERTIAGGFAE